jgi:hypothetical protein
MSFLDDLTKIVSTVTTGVIDEAVGGPMGPILRQQLRALKTRQRHLISTYQKERKHTEAWAAPVNQTASLVTSILQKTSDYIQGLAISYNSILKMASVDMPMVNAIQKAGVAPHQLIDLNIPGEIGGIPSVLIPGVFALETLTGIGNAVADSATVPLQIAEVTKDNSKLLQAIEEEQVLHHKLSLLRDYLLDIGTRAIGVYEHATGLRFDAMPLTAHTPQDLAALNQRLLTLNKHLEDVNGNAFMIFRVIITLIKSGKVAQTGPREAQLDYLAKKLYFLPSVSAVFPSQGAVRQFVENFFQGHSLAVTAVFLRLPPVPNSLRSIVSQTPSQHHTLDLFSSRYDQPADLDLSEFDPIGGSDPAASITISNTYVWLESVHSLPLEFSCTFVCNAHSDEFLPCFSKTRAEWPSQDCDALSWYISPHRHDFTFRTQLFRAFPTVSREGSGFNVEVGRPYKMKCQIRKDTATYWIDDQRYATATYAPGTVPSTGQIGFAVFGPAQISVKDVAVTGL